MKTIIQLFAIFILVILLIFLFFSPNSSPNQELLYSFKRLQENSFKAIKSFSLESKTNFQSHLLNTRLAELESLVGQKEWGYILKASSRYSTTAGELAELIKNNQLTDKITSAKLQFEQHQKTLNDLIVLCKKNENTECKYIQDDVNYLILYTDILSSVR